MAYDFEKNVRSNTREETEIDLGLKAYMNKVYSFMAVGLALTGTIAHMFSQLAFNFETNQLTPLGSSVYGSPLGLIIALAPLGFMLAISFGISKMKESTVQILYWSFAAVMGISLGSIFIQYTGESVARVFFITAGSFGALSLYGYTKKKRLIWMGFFFIYGINWNNNSINCKYIHGQ